MQVPTRLFDETTWHGKGLRVAMNAPKVAVVLVYFAGLFAVIAADSLRRRGYKSLPKGARQR